ncbi:MAG TPA: amino acid adenylation domain-containing protein, partial [Thermoanaerobaculia bacterium]|nr:amino acid adenylation domain-containing protein [Thermoanaerobaculia bacterium]
MESIRRDLIIPARQELEREPASSLAPLTYGQRSLWFLHHLAPVGGAYNIAAAARVHTPIDAMMLERAFQTLVDRHSALRTTFLAVGGTPYQRIAGHQNLVLACEDVTGWSEERLQSRLAEEAWRPFDLERGPLLRVTLLTGDPAGPVLLLAVHHIVADFWSLAILIRELPVLYREAAGEGPPLRLHPPGLSYEEHVRLEREALADGRGEALLAWWRESLAGLPTLELALDRPRPAVQTYRGDCCRLRLPGEIAAALRALSRERHGTLFMTLVAAFQAFLSRHSGQEDLAIGTPRSGRSQSKLAGTVGYFVNPVVLRGDLAGDPSFAELLERTKATVLAAFAHGEYPLPLLAENLQPARDASRTPLFQVSFVMQKETRGAEGLTAFALGEEGVEVGPEDFRLESLSLERPPVPFDLMLHAVERQGGLSFALQYNSDLFDTTTGERLMARFVVLLRSIARGQDLALSALPILPEAERYQTLCAWNDTADTVSEANLFELFTAQAERSGDDVAVVFEGEQLTYRELAERAAAVARDLTRLGVGPEVLVGVAAERSVELVVGLLGVLGAGGAYLPLEPSLPRQRLAMILEDARPAVVLTHRAYVSSLPLDAVPGARLACLDNIGSTASPPWGEAAAGLPLARPSAGNAAYVIYTSGSTGRPKGVVNSHRGILNRLLWMQEAFGLSTGERFLHKTPFGFDVSVPELFAPLILGGRLVVARPEGHRDSAYLVRLVQQEAITTIHFVPSMLPFFLDEEGMVECRSLRRVLVSGEALSWELEQRCLERLPVPLYNLYGPTEAAVEVTAWACRRSVWMQPVPIGRPIRNAQIHVLGRWLELAPPGAVGELAIGGVQVARGYLGRPDLTAERFIPDPFSPESGTQGARLYRTGDLCRYLPAGEVEYLGRLDDQVKIRGFRIEPREIEIALAAHPAVREAAVVVLNKDAGAERSLLACVVLRRAPGGDEPSAAMATELRGFLAARLPPSMVPALAFGGDLDRLPNGKLDRRSLARWTPITAVTASGRAAGAPRTPLEELLAGFFAEVLGVERIGVEDSFFEYGGHSLAAMRLVTRVRESLGVELPLHRIFETPAVADLVKAIEGGAKSDIPLLVPVPRDQPLPLSFAQQRLWFLHQLEPASPVYNVPAAVYLQGLLDRAVLAAALGEVVRRHESLRTRFAARQGGPVQVIDPASPLALSVIDLAGLPAVGRTGEARRLARGEALRPFDLAVGPLLRAGLVSLGAGEHLLLLTLHHVVSDGWSLRLLARELEEIYSAFAERRPSPLPSLEIQYGDYAVWQRRWLQGELLVAELAHWRERLADAPSPLELPLDRPRPAAVVHHGDRRVLVLPPALVRSLRVLARRQGVTLFMALLAAFQALLSRMCGTEDVSVGTPVAGRNQIRIEGLIGFFVNTLVMRTDLSGEPPFTALLVRVRAVTLAAYAHQELPFEKLVEELQPRRDLSYSPLFQAAFTLDDQPVPALRLGGVEAVLWPLEPETEKFDLSLTVGVDGEGLAGALGFRTDLFDGATVERLAGGLVRLLSGVVAEPGLRLSELPLLSVAEREQLLVEWNDVGTLPPSDATLHGLFEAQAARTPGATALVAGRSGERWTYRELDLWSDSLARRLSGLGVGGAAGLEVRVGVCLPRTPLLVASLLGVLKAGGAYVPLDPEYPAERLSLMLEDSAAAVVLTEKDFAARLSGHGAELLLVEPPVSRPSRRMKRSASGVEPGNLAYLIYTSGSTGRPKGVAIEHRSAVAFAHWARTVFAPEELAGVLAATSVSFDLSVFEIFVTLSWGGTVVLAADVLELPHLAAASEGVLINTVPSAMAELVRQRAIPESVRTVNLAGEPLKRSLADALYESSSVSRVLDLYGPSEATTYSTWALVSRVEGREPAIGRPIAGSRVVLLGRCGELVPV